MALKQDIGVACNMCDSCMGFKIHGWRKFCIDCKCSVENHDISDEFTISMLDEMKLSDKQFYASYQESLALAEKVHKSWLPIALKINEIDEFLSQLNTQCDDRHRKRYLRLQIPVTDRCVEKFCHLETPSERQEAEKYLHTRNNRDLGLGYITRTVDDKSICADCHINLGANTLAVSIEDNHSDSKQFWHPSCFKCTCCKELLVDYIYGAHSHRIFCIRHYAKSIRPRCGACDELIFSSEYIRANDEEFHNNHFACALCDNSLSKQTYINYHDSAICKLCYEQKFGNQCSKCSRLISVDCKDVCYNGSHWHEDCFHCVACDVPLVESLFTVVSGDNRSLPMLLLFCEQCNREQNVPRCEGCHQPMENGSKVTDRPDGRCWHVDCVVCDECKTTVLGTVEPYICLDGRSICTACFDSKFGGRCGKCDEVVRGGVSYQGVKYHHSCFKCCNCSCAIVNSKYFTKNGTFYCKACYDRLFASPCAKCGQLISAESGLKYIKYEERCWHVGCFCCHKCTGTIVDKSFLTKDGNYFCTNCGI